ncbi:arginase family protein [Xanthomonas maliensis]|uniref:arginase family protein n=1 Tax=Xanthomonas maliensis TaxID=1321368 RepID=UPI0003A16320|nr:arginase family protein [Xanthomonas maliensis]KAB7770558.1 hypothetical protein CKY51_04300 [Xanthomonas maliensis]
MSPALVLDLDGSNGQPPGGRVVALQHWQERIRFGCSHATLRQFVQELQPALADSHGTVLLGSGDFHHLSWPLIQRVAERSARPLQVVVLDNHPDNMRYPFGVHCGSWVRQVAALPQVARVHMVGLCSSDAGSAHCWEQYLTPLRQGRLHYWCLGVDTRWARLLGCADAVHGFDEVHALLTAFAARADAQLPVYLSIDKDVFAEHVARTNWDQGRFDMAAMHQFLEALKGPLIGSDITGEISHYRYRSWFKRLLSALDGQQPPELPQLRFWQAGQHALNRRLLGLLDTYPRLAI